MRALQIITTITLLSLLAISCKEDKVTAPTKAAPVVIKEVTFPDGNTTRPAKQNTAGRNQPTKMVPTKATKPANSAESDKIAEAHLAQQTVRDNSVRDLRRLLMSKCLMGIKERPMLSFTVHKNGNITDHNYLRKDDQSKKMEVPQDIKTCLDAIIAKQDMGPLDIKRPNRKVQETITITIPL